MIGFHWDCIESQLEIMQGMIHTFMLAPLFFTNSFGWYGRKEVIS